MTGDERQELRVAVSSVKRERVRRSGGFESDGEREETLRSMRRRAAAEWIERVRALEQERDELARRCAELEAWVDVAYSHPAVKPPCRARP